MKQRTVRPLWLSNAPWAGSGYGNQTALFVPRLMQAGFLSKIVAFYGLEGAPIDLSGITIFPKMAHPYGVDSAYHHYHKPLWNGKRSNLMISLIDPHALAYANNQLVPGQIQQLRAMNWLAIAPIDSQPAIDANVNTLQLAARWVWSISKHGQYELNRKNVRSTYVPHGIDSTVYHPIDRAAARKDLSTHLDTDLSDKTVFVTVAANKATRLQPRKDWHGMFAAMHLHVQKHPNTVWYCHTIAQTTHDGYDLYAMRKRFGLDGKVFFPQSQNMLVGEFKPDFLNKVYNTADAFFLFSSEGFGIPTVEAQMAGCPVLVADFAASRELCMTGKLLPVGYAWWNESLGSYWAQTNVNEAVRALEWVESVKGNEELRKEAREKAMAYDINHVFNTYALPALELIDQQLQREETRPEEIVRLAKGAA